MISNDEQIMPFISEYFQQMQIQKTWVPGILKKNLSGALTNMKILERISTILIWSVHTIKEMMKILSTYLWNKRFMKADIEPKDRQNLSSWPNQYGSDNIFLAFGSVITLIERLGVQCSLVDYGWPDYVQVVRGSESVIARYRSSFDIRSDRYPSR